jgi:3-oxoadipate enol-lactonase
MTVPLHHTIDGPDALSGAGSAPIPAGSGAGQRGGSGGAGLGEGAPLLVLGASLGTTGAIWQPQLPVLAERFRVVRYDHRGHGQSPAPAGPYRLDDLGGDVLALLDTLGADRVMLGGISIGGAVAAWVAAHAPDRIDRLALLATSVRFGTPSLWAERAAAVRAGGIPAIADTVVGRWFTPGFATRHAAVVGWVRQQLVSTPVEPYASCCAALEKLDLAPLLGSITAPTLVLAGADDPVSPPEHARDVAGSVPGATTEIVPDAAHLLNVEQPDHVSRVLVDFFGGADG